MATAEVKRYWTQLANMGCIICQQPAEIAHCHGGSMRYRGFTKAGGKKLPYMDWLVLPICPRHHRLLPESLDYSVDAFEICFGTQEAWLDLMVRRTGIDIWKKAKSRHDWARGAT
jgi:hypothetical protein